MAYLGNEPQKDTVINVKKYTAEEGQTTFNAVYQDYVNVTVNGLAIDEYTATDGMTVVLDSPLSAGDKVKIEGFSSLAYLNSYVKSETDTLLDAKADISVERPTKVSPTEINVDGTVLELIGGVAGTDYYFSKTAITTVQNADTIGGFHYSLVPHTEAPTGNKTEADMVLLRGINAHSIWTKWFRPKCNPEGMFYALGCWYDIYQLNSEHIANGTSKAGATIAGGVVDANGRAIPKIPLEFGGDETVTYGKFTWFQAAEIASSHSKRLISYDEFGSIAYGVLEGASSQTNGYETVAGKVEHYSQLMSKYGMEQATGVQWIWGANVGADDPANGWQDQADSRGQIYGTATSPKAVLMGGHRDTGVFAGSRASAWSFPVWNSNWNIGSRFACNHLEVR